MNVLKTMDPRARAAVLALLAIVGFIAVRRLRSGTPGAVDVSALPVEPGLTGAAALGGAAGSGTGFGAPIVLTPPGPNDPNAGLVFLGYAPDGTPIYGPAPVATSSGAVGGQTDGAAGVEPAAAPGNATVVAAASSPRGPTVTFNAPPLPAYTAPVPIALVTAHPTAFAPGQPTYEPAAVAAAAAEAATQRLPPLAVGSTRDPNVYLQLGRKLELNP